MVASAGADCASALSTLLFWSISEKEAVDDPVASAFRRHYKQVYRFLRRRTDSDDVAEDLAPTVFVDAAARLRHLERDGPPVLAWSGSIRGR